MSGFFITFEGPDGCGKTTIIKKIHDYLIKHNFSVLETREPGGRNDVCEEIRKIIMKNGRYIDPYSESLLFASSRAQHVNQVIKPAIKENKIVLCDRFLDSSIVFQGFGKKIGEEKILMINDYFLNGFRPDLTIYFNLDPKIGIERIKNDKNRKMNRMDQESLKMQYEIYEGYLYLINKEPKRFFVVDASLAIEEVFEQTLEKILSSIGKKYVL